MVGGVELMGWDGWGSVNGVGWVGLIDGWIEKNRNLLM